MRTRNDRDGMLSRLGRCVSPDAIAGITGNSIILLTVEAALGPGGASVTLPAAWLALLNEDNKFKDEQVVFFGGSG